MRGMIRSSRLPDLRELLEDLNHLEIHIRSFTVHLTLHFRNEAPAQPRKKLPHALFCRAAKAPLQIIWVSYCNLLKCFPQVLPKVDDAIIFWRIHHNRLVQAILCLLEPLQPNVHLLCVRTKQNWVAILVDNVKLKWTRMQSLRRTPEEAAPSQEPPVTL